MKTSIVSFAIGVALLSAAQLDAATNVVILGGDFQAAINAAASGDTLVVQSGVYSGNLNFAKPLTIVCSGAQIQLTGTATVSGAGTTLFSQTQFQSALQVQTNATIVISLSTCSSGVTLSGGNIQAFDSQFTTLTATGGAVTMKRCNASGAINLSATSFEGLRLTNASSISATAPVGSGIRCVIVQSALNFVTLAGYSAWLGYDAVTIASLTDCNSVMVGNQLNPGNPSGTTAAIYAVRGTLKAHNNRIAISTDNNSNGRAMYGIWMVNSSGEIVNNSIWVDAYQSIVNNLLITRGIIATSGGGPIKISADIIKIAYPIYAGYYDIVGVDASAQQVSEVSYCDLQINLGPAWNGGNGVNNIGPDPLFNGDLTLASGSPCIHAGPPAAIYNNTDGSQNAIGATGGPQWNPADYTNSNPMVFWLSTSNQTVLKGLQSTIPASVAASAGH